MLSSHESGPLWRQNRNNVVVRHMDKRVNPADRERWLASKKDWKDVPGGAETWIGKKVIGIGGYGIIGLYRSLGMEVRMLRERNWKEMN